MIIAAAVLGFARPARATPPNAPAADPGAPESEATTDWELVNQVLEIPQACTRDGKVLACDDRAVVGESGAAAASPDDSTAPGVADGSTEETAAVGDDWGTIQDYENQGVAIGPVISTASGYGGALWIPPSRSAFAVAPLSRPLATGGRLGPPGPWLISPSATWGRPAGAPMMMPGRPFPLR
jgi:hypothetical protein